MKIKHLSVLAVTLCLSHSIMAQFRKYSNEFLNIGAGARGLGMGGAQVVSVNDATAGYWNPAALVGIKDYPQIAAMHADYFAGIGKYDYIGIGVPIKDEKRVVGLSILRFAVDDIPNTLFLVEPDGSVNYNNIRTFSSADYAFVLSYAQKIKDTKDKKLSFGGNAKIIYRKVGSFASAMGFGFDAGIKYETPKWKFGLAARDITTTFNAWSFSFSDKEKEALYLTNNDIPVKSVELTAPRLIAGAARSFNLNKKFSLTAEANLDLSFDGQRNTVVSSKAINIDPRIGIEASYQNSIFFRAGISNFQKGLADGDTLNQKKVWIYQPSIGAGFKIKNVMFDYAFTNLANQSNPLFTHIISLRLELRKND